MPNPHVPSTIPRFIQYARRLTGSDRGFTIVELLIVIVVIAVLASITIVAYNGIQVRAANTATLTGVDQFNKAVQLYKTSTGEFPFIGVYPGFAYACVAQVGESCGRVGGTADATCGNIGPATGQAALDTPIKSVAGKMPAVSSQTMQCDNKIVKGALYYTWGGSDSNGYLLYYLNGNVSCAASSGSELIAQTYYASGTTACTLRYNA